MADQLVNDVETLISSLAAASYSYTTYINGLYTLYNRIMSGGQTRDELNRDKAKVIEIFNNLNRYNRYFGSIVNKFNKQTGPQIINKLKTMPQQKVQSVTHNMIKMADFLDQIGAYELADELDKIAEEINEPIQHPNEGTLSTRYCPDHNGIQAVRISECVYQCPIDGKVYNYETGYINYKGQRIPGGSVAAQTPNTSDTGGIPMRFYDSRQSILNRVN